MANSVHQSARARARRLFFSVAAGVGMMALPALARASDPVMDWNDIARQLTVIPALAAVEQTRAMAIVQVAIHDAVSAVTGQYEQVQAHASGARRRLAAGRRDCRRAPGAHRNRRQLDVPRRILRGVARQVRHRRWRPRPRLRGVGRRRHPGTSSQRRRRGRCLRVSPGRRWRGRRVDTHQRRAGCPVPAAGMGQGRAVGAQERVAVPAGSSAGAEEQTLRPGLQRDPLHRGADQLSTDRRTDAG